MNAVLPYAWCWHRSRPGTDFVLGVCVTVRTSRQTQGSLQRPIKVPREESSKKLQSNSGQRQYHSSEYQEYITAKEPIDAFDTNGRAGSLFAPCSRLQQRLQREYYRTVVLGAAPLMRNGVCGNHAEREQCLTRRNERGCRLCKSRMPADRRGSGGGATNDNSGNEDWAVLGATIRKKRPIELFQ